MAQLLQNLNFRENRTGPPGRNGPVAPGRNGPVAPFKRSCRPFL